MDKMTPEQVLQISKGDNEIASFIHSLLTIIDQQQQQIHKLEQRVHELERQLGKNSNNSSKPPSSDGLRKPVNLRQPGGKKGAPKGHEGNTLRFSDHPDEVVNLYPEICSSCAASLKSQPTAGYEKRQVFDLPEPSVMVTETRANKICCKACGRLNQAAFPPDITAPTQYGKGFAAWAAYLHAYQMMPLDRMAQFFADLTGCRPSEATLLNLLGEVGQQLEPAEQAIKTALLSRSFLHADETGSRVCGKTQWVHDVSDALWTMLQLHEKRGTEGMEAMGVLPNYKGVLIHDCLGSYFKPYFTFEHALCNAHLLRECIGIHQNDKHQWAEAMTGFLRKCWERVKTARATDKPLTPEEIAADINEYRDILKAGEAEWSQDPVREKTGPRGRKIKSKAANLAERFRIHEEKILRFIWDARIPFDNNQAERDLRMIKVKLKISGSFRTKEGAELFLRIRSVISTLLKQNLPVLQSLKAALQGNQIFPIPTT